MNYNLIIQPEAEYDIQDAFDWYITLVPLKTVLCQPGEYHARLEII
jgi:hypothetical protein